MSCDISLWGQRDSDRQERAECPGACVKSGDCIELICDGEDEEKALETLVALIEDGFGE